jgi:hypothetical protein
VKALLTCAAAQGFTLAAVISGYTAHPHDNPQDKRVAVVLNAGADAVFTLQTHIKRPTKKTPGILNAELHIHMRHGELLFFNSNLFHFVTDPKKDKAKRAKNKEKRWAVSFLYRLFLANPTALPNYVEFGTSKEHPGPAYKYVPGKSHKKNAAGKGKTSETGKSTTLSSAESEPLTQRRRIQ